MWSDLLNFSRCCVPFLRLRETHNALQLPVFFFFFFFLFLSQPCPEYRGNSEQKIILQTIKQLIQYTVLEILFQSLKYMAVIRIHKNLSNFPSLSKQYKAIKVRWCKQPTSNSFQTCLYCITYSNCMIINYYISDKLFNQYL